MPIDFTPDRWNAVRETYRRWWSGELGRPVVAVELVGRDPGRPEPVAPLLSQANCHRFDVPAEDVIDRLDYELSRRVYLGDAFPWVSLDAFGPGVLAAVLGARLENTTGQVWFLPPAQRPIGEIRFEVDAEDVWLRRIKDLCAAAAQRWQGAVLVGMADLGGNLDVLSTFRPGEQLLLDLYDHPSEVKRLTWEAHRAWHRVFDEIHAVLRPANPGYTDWTGIYSDQPGYTLQCDFSYMISPAMFDEFARPELEATARRLAHSVYHLDGVGALSHLGSVLSIDGLDGVQWVPGAGKPDCRHWPEVYRKIHAAGKRIQVVHPGFGVLDAVVEQLGTGRGVQQFVWQAPMEQEREIRWRLESYGIG
jgi:5-methyltetrahydrofolate--homocysteine methyltransferase